MDASRTSDAPRGGIRQRNRVAHAHVSTREEATAADAIKTQKKVQEAITDDLLGMAKVFKQQQENLNTHTKEDRTVVDEADRLISENSSQMELLNARLEKFTSSTSWGTCKIILGLLMCMGVFMVTFLFMRFVPKQ